MNKIIAVCNQKGGVGKTTTSINTAAGLAVLEKKVLLVDFDPQSNASQGLGFTQKFKEDIYTALCWEDNPPSPDDISRIIKKTDLVFLDLFPCSQDLAALEVELSGFENRETRLKTVISSVCQNYEYVIIDAPPSLNLLTVNILVAADSVIIPIQCEYYALAGLAELVKIIKLIRNKLNPKLAIEGLLFTMFDSRLNLARQVVEDVRQNFEGNVFNTIIPRNVTLSESPSFGKPAILYDVTCSGAVSYLELAKELVNHG